MNKKRDVLQKLFLISIVVALSLISDKDMYCGVQTEFNVLDFGAKNDSSELCTASIQSTIDVCYEEGGGYVVFPSGLYLTGTLFLKDNVYLKVEPGATILGSKDINDYDPRFLIYAKDASNFGIVGPGFINGQGDFYWLGKQRPFNRPERTIKFINCQNILLRDFNLRNSASWCIDVEGCDQVTITGVSIINERDAPNTDGIDPVSSSNVFISDCYINTGDDAICLKSSNENKPCENLVVTNCVLISDDSAIKCGTSSNGAIRNCTFSNIVIRNTKYGIGFYMKDGGCYEDIQFSNITIETVTQDYPRPDRGTNSYPIFMDIEARDRDSKLGIIRNIMFSDININTVDGNCLFLGMPEQMIENVTLDNVIIRVLSRSDLSGRRKPRGTRKLKNIAPNDYAHVSSHFTFAYIDGLNIRNLIIKDETTHKQFERHAIWALNIDNVVIDGFRQQQAIDNSTQSVFKFTNGKDISIHGCKPVSPHTTFLELAGDVTADITLFGNDFTKVKSDIKLLDKVYKKAVFEYGNRRK